MMSRKINFQARILRSKRQLPPAAQWERNWKYLLKAAGPWHRSACSFCKGHTGQTSGIFRREQPSPAAQQFQRLSLEIIAPFLFLREALCPLPVPHSLSQWRLFFQAEGVACLCRVLVSTSCGRVFERQLRKSDTRWSFQFTVQLPENRQNRCQEDSLISLSCFILTLHKQDGIKKNKCYYPVRKIHGPPLPKSGHT